jgi:hypothetical protein
VDSPNAMQHNDFRHISSIDGRGHFHRKKIARSLLVAYRPAKQIAFAASSIAKRPHCRKNYCGASPIFAETSLISPSN